MTLLVASFDSKRSLTEALPRLRDAALGRIETYSPQPISEGPSILPLVVLIAGLAGTAVGFWMQSYVNTTAYPINIGGRPQFSWPAFVPIAFEIGMLCAVAAGFFGFLIVNRLPRLYDPVDEADLLRGATRDRWCVAIDTDRPEPTRDLLRHLSATTIEMVSE